MHTTPKYDELPFVPGFAVLHCHGREGCHHVPIPVDQAIKLEADGMHIIWAHVGLPAKLRALGPWVILVALALRLWGWPSRRSLPRPKAMQQKQKGN